MTSIDFSGDLASARWPEGAAAMVEPAIALEMVWKAERAPLREEEFCAHLADLVGAAIVTGMGDELIPQVSVTLTEQGNMIFMLLRLEAVFSDMRAATAKDLDRLSAILDDAENQRFWIWSAVDATAYKGVAQ